jgi:hypothetical protein
LYTLLCVFLQDAHAAYVYGRYEGDGNATQAVSGLGFQPEVILVKGAGSQTAWIATSTMTAGDAKLLNVETAPQTGIISSIDADGFTVANSSNSNSSGVDYFFVAWDDADGNVEVGTFTPEPDAYDSSSTYSAGSIIELSGTYYEALEWISINETPNVSPGSWDELTLTNPVSGSSINLGYEPFMVWSITEGTNWYDNAQAQFIIDNVDSTDSKAFNQGTSLGGAEGIVTAITTSGFNFTTPANPGIDAGVVKGVQYHYVAFKPALIGGSGTYTGDTDGDRGIYTGTQLDFVFVVDSDGGQNPWFKTAAMGGDSSYKFTDVVSTINITTFEADSFRIGNGGEVNGAGISAEWFGMGSGTLLPVEWLHFYGRPTVDGDYLSWSTASEINTDYFEIQISYDGLNFETVGYTSAQGNSVVKTSYDYLHASAINEVRYYRLKQVDLDGKFDFSKIIVIQPGGYSDISLFPNPANNQFFIHSDNPILSIEVYNSIGEIIYADYDFNEVSSQYNSEVLIKNWSSGTYHVVVQNSFSRISKRLIIK